MQLNRWRTLWAVPSPKEPNTRLRMLWSAALKTEFYRNTQCDVEHGDSPSIDLDTYQSNLDQFHNPRGRLPGFQTLQHPVRNGLKTAVLLEGFRVSKIVGVFSAAKRRDIAAFRPDAIAGPLDALLDLADDKETGRLALPTLRHAIIVFTRVGGPHLCEEDRCLLWDVFQVPVFEQFLGFANELLASECEAHEGLHIQSERALFELEDQPDPAELLVTSLENLRYPVIRLATGLSASIETGTCGCGSNAPRLVEITSLSEFSNFAVA